MMAEVHVRHPQGMAPAGQQGFIFQGAGAAAVDYFVKVVLHGMVCLRGQRSGGVTPFFQDDVAVFGGFTGNDDGIGLFGAFIEGVALHLFNVPVIVQRLAVFGLHRRVQESPGTGAIMMTGVA